MAGASEYMLPYKEIAEVFVKHLGIHEGNWSVYVKFGIQGANMSINDAPHLPTAIVPITQIGIHREDEPGPLAVDAALVNPATPARRRRRRTTRSSNVRKVVSQSK